VPRLACREATLNVPFLQSAIHMDGQDSVDCAKIMRLEGETDDAAVKARKRGPRSGPTCLAVHCV
jgi:hypothetical protein